MMQGFLDISAIKVAEKADIHLTFRIVNFKLFPQLFVVHINDP